MKKVIEGLVHALPEVYQTIYGHPDLSQVVSRECHDRLVEINVIYSALEKKLGRPLRVLDLGCAQGFFCLSLAERGASVLGIDFLKENIELCNALAEENPQLNVKFSQGRVEEVIAQLGNDEFDLVTGLSVFHHIVYQNGLETVRNWIGEMAEKVSALIFELALKSEPLYWAEALPADTKELISKCAFVHELGHFPTHLSQIERPLYVASNHYWIFGEKLGAFDSAKHDPHAYADNVHKGSRKYYFSEEFLVKLFDITTELKERNIQELKREADFLSNPPEGFGAPNLLTYGENDSEAWLIMEFLPGKLLLDAIKDQQQYDEKKVVLSILEKLIILEKHNLYHDDLRTWNIILQSNNEAKIIDYGSITAEKRDCIWPYNVYLSFFILLSEVVNKDQKDINPLRSISISPSQLPSPYNKYLEPLWAVPSDEWSFEKIYQCIAEGKINPDETTALTMTEVWMNAMESGLQSTVEYSKYVHNESMVVKSQLENVENIRRLEQLKQQELSEEQTRLKELEMLEFHEKAEELAKLKELEMLELHEKAEELARLKELEKHEQLKKSEQQKLLELEKEQQALKLAELQYEHKSQQLEKLDGLEKLISDKFKKIENSIDGELSIIKQKLHETEVALHHSHNHINAMHTSTSWRITSPIRFTKRVLVGSRNEGVKASVVRVSKRVVLKFSKLAFNYVRERPKLKAFAISSAHRLGVYSKLHSLYHRFKKQPQPVYKPQPATPSGENDNNTVMSGETGKIYSYLVKTDSNIKKKRND